jgi:comEA protein
MRFGGMILKNKSLVIMIALTLSFMVFIAGYITGISTDRSVVLSENLPTDATTSVYEDGKININTATVSDLIQLPGIGEKLAGNIISYRENNGPFKSMNELIRVEGIGTKKLSILTEYLTVTGG